MADIEYTMFDRLDGERTADLYQLSAYCRVLGLGSGALISCIADSSPDPTGDKVTVQNSNTELHLWPVDLRGRLHQIEADIRRLADRIGSLCPYIDEQGSIGGSTSPAWESPLWESPAVESLDAWQSPPSVRGRVVGMSSSCRRHVVACPDTIC